MAPQQNNLANMPISNTFRNAMPSYHIGYFHHWISHGSSIANYTFEFPAIVLQLQFLRYSGKLVGIQIAYPHLQEREDLIEVLKKDMFALYADFSTQVEDPLADQAVFENMIMQMLDRVKFYNLPRDLDQHATYAGNWLPPRFLFPGFRGHNNVPMTYVPGNRSGVARVFSRLGRSDSNAYPKADLGRFVQELLSRTPVQIMRHISHPWMITHMARMLRYQHVRDFQRYRDAVSKRISSAAYNLHEVLAPGSRLEERIALGESPTVKELREDLLQPRLTWVCVTDAEADRIARVGFSVHDKNPTPGAGTMQMLWRPKGGIRSKMSAAQVLAEGCTRAREEGRDHQNLKLVACATLLGSCMRTWRWWDMRALTGGYESMECDNGNLVVCDERAILPCFIISVTSIGDISRRQVLDMENPPAYTPCEDPPANETDSLL